MPGSPPHSTGLGDGRLERCIRDLAALNALPSMCVGRTPRESLEIVLDALPTVLNCDLVYLRIPGSPPHHHASLERRPVTQAQLDELDALTADDAEGGDPLVIIGGHKLWCLQAEVPMGAERGVLLAGRALPLDPETDRALIRTAANVVGTTLENANVLEVARRKDDFLAMLGHELRNPLAPILTATELLARDGVAPREQEIIARNTRHLARLVDDLLDIARIARGHVELRDEQVPLATALQRAAELVGPVVTRQRHTLCVDSGDGVTLRGDPVRLVQIFGNLLSNAAKFTPPAGRIELKVEPGPERVRVTVRDNGRGLAADQLVRVFEPFVQVDRSRDALQGGLGLGLAIVKNLVERHGGTISAHSDGPGLGAAFTVELPTAARVEQSAAAPQHGAPRGRSGLRVLVVDDNVDIAELLAEALADEGFETAIAYDAQSAVEQWRSFKPDAAVLDVGLPDRTGYELAQALRAEHGTKALLVAVTGYGQPRDRQRATEAGFDCHFVKPLSVQDLVQVLDQRLVQPRATAAATVSAPAPTG